MIVSRTIAYSLLISTVGLSGCWQDSEKIKEEKTVDAGGWVDSPADYVNPFIGTQGVNNHRQAANVTPGAVLPYGMFNFGPEHAYTEDLLAESERMTRLVIEQNGSVPVSPGGYNYQASRVKGFSFTRLSGTGCLGASGEVPVLPFTKPIKHSPDTDKLDAYYSAAFSHANETAEPGYYQVKMDNGVNVELSSTLRSGIAKFTYDDASDAKLLFRTSYTQIGSGAAVTNIDIENNEISGYVTSGNFCGYLGEFNQRDYYTLHFVAKLDTRISSFGAWKDDTLSSNTKQISGAMGYGEKGIPKLGKGSGVWVELDAESAKPVVMRVGISYVSKENARENLQTEQREQSFSQIRKSAKTAWNQALAKVAVKSDDKEALTTFYTALFHSQFHPNVFSDVNGQYSGFDGKVHQIKHSQQAQYANFSGWDVYRSQLQLVTMLDKTRGSDIAQSLLNQAEQYNGVWDRWTHNSGATGVMSGDPSTIAIANFVAFGAINFDIEAAYSSLYKAATVATTFDLNDEGCPVFCRGQHPSLDEWQSLNYLSDQSNSWEGVSETLEQSSAYFALSQLASRLGENKHAQRFLTESSYWQNLYNENATETYGYLQGRNKDGSWKDKFEPFSRHLFVEGSPAQYLWMVPFDGGGLKALVGGDKAMSERLDSHFHKADGTWVLFRDSAEYADVSNQPSIATPWMYLFSGDAYKTQETVRETMTQLWNNTPKGIPGQDDLGQMSSWYVFSALGLYPLYPGRADFVISTPVFSQAKIGNITINAPEASVDNKFIEQLKVNGKTTLNSWINESHVEEPITLDFNVAPTPNKQFGAEIQHRPPSFNGAK